MCRKFSFCACSFLLFICCHAPFKSQNQLDRLDETLNLNKKGEAENKITFLTYEVTLADSIKDEYKFRLIKTFFTNGSLKKTLPNQGDAKEPAYLYYELENGSKQPNLFKVKDPLKMVLEFPGENGVLNKKTFRVKKGELTIRFQFEKNLKTISIFKVEPNSLTLTKVYHAAL